MPYSSITRNLVLLLAAATALATAAETRYARIDIVAAGNEEVVRLKNRADLLWWMELGDQLLVLAPQAELARLARLRPTEILAVAPRPDLLRLARGHLEGENTLELARGGRFAVVQLRSAANPPVSDHGHGHDLLPFKPNQVLAVRAENRPVKIVRKRREQAVEELLDQIDSHRWFKDIHRLQCYNRHVDHPDNLRARDWLADQFRALPGTTVSIKPFTFGSRTAYNVVAVLPGRYQPNDLYIAGAHYDSRNNSLSSTSPTPGAEDNASGTAAVLEMARIFSHNPPPATLVFLCYSGEEHGLHGSAAHAQSLLDDGTATNVKAVLVMDMIGYTADATLDLLLESNNSNEALVNAFTLAAQSYTNMDIVVSFNPFGSDHVAYLNRSMPALLVIENDWNRYPNYHRAGDTTDLLGLEMGTQVMRMNLATLAEMMGFGSQIESAAPYTLE